VSATRVAWVLVLALFAVAPAVHAAGVAVAPIRDAGKRGQGEALRKQLEHGLSDGGVPVVGAVALAAGARKQGIGAAELGKPAVLVSVARASGATAVLQGTLSGKGKNQELQIRVFSLEGVELWSRNLKLEKGKLRNDHPAKVARAVTAALAAAPAATATTPDIATTPDASATTPDASTTPDGTEAVTPVKPDVPEKPRKAETKPPPTDEGETPIVKPTKRKPAKKAVEAQSSDGESEGENAIEGPPKEAKADTQPQPPIIDVGVGFALISRTYNLCPGVKSCSEAGPQPTPDGLDTPISYKTSAPSGGFILRGELFPLPKLIPVSDAATITIGVTAEYLRSFPVSNNYVDPVTGAPGKFSSSMSRLSADLAGRVYFRLLNGTGYAGLFGGYLAPQFTAAANPLLLSSARKGFDVGAATELPLAGDYVKFAAQASYAIAANPGQDETNAYGQLGKGSGFLVRGGLAGGYQYIGYSAFADFARFADSFPGQGLLTTNGAVAEETYTTFWLMLHGRY
jgi:hypothetical protein